MSMKTSYELPEEDDVDFSGVMGWLAVVAFALAMGLFTATFYFEAF